MIVRHKARGSRYWVIRIAECHLLQDANDGDIVDFYGVAALLQTAVVLRGQVELVLYQNELKQHWLRPYDEFFDGRFKVISP